MSTDVKETAERISTERLEAAVRAFMPLAQVAFLWTKEKPPEEEVSRYRDAYHDVWRALASRKSDAHEGGEVCKACNGSGSDPLAHEAALHPCKVCKGVGADNSNPRKETVGVKPLEWEKTGERDWVSDCILGQYTLNRDLLEAGGAFSLWKAGWESVDDFEDFETEKEAKAAAQADYEQRIRSALTAAPFNPVVSDEMVERALKAWFHPMMPPSDENYTDDMRTAIEAALSVNPQIGSNKP